MAEYIERKAAYNVLSKYYHHSTELQHEALREAINRVPTADVQPVVHGKWVQIKLLQDGYKAKECSACKATFWDLYRWNYCPNCGAKMDGET